ncbi:MAG TPA: 50S ribosomal protein L25 [Candidatus Uhrbacteria bacterium]|nr:50S ribosomal protein L25 [Candidatus Uhrbacteria bacterium]
MTYLKAKTRKVLGRKNRGLRSEELIPGVLYGHDVKNKNLSVKKSDFLKIYQSAGSSRLVDLQIEEDNPVKTLIQSVQTDPVKDEIIHVDFYQVREDEKVTTKVELEFINEAPAVKELGGILVKNYDEVEIECLPKYLELIDKIKVDLSSLKAFNDAVHIKDLQVPPEIKITESLDEAVAFIAEPEEEKVEVPAAEAPSEPELAEKKGKEAEEVEGENNEKNAEKKQ